MKYIHTTKTINSIEIDEEMIPLIQLLWKNDIRTYCSCQGGPLDPEEYDPDGDGDDSVFLEGESNVTDIDSTYYMDVNGNLCEYKLLIIHKDDLTKFQQVVCDIMSQFNILVGSGGYMLEWINNCPPYKDLLTIYWE